MSSGFDGLAYPEFVPTPGRYCQFENEHLDYEIDWSDVLPTGDTVIGSAWTGDTGITLDLESSTPTTTTVWVSGGSPDYCYKVVNTVVTAGGRVMVRELFFRIKAT